MAQGGVRAGRRRWPHRDLPKRTHLVLLEGITCRRDDWSVVNLPAVRRWGRGVTGGRESRVGEGLWIHVVIELACTVLRGQFVIAGHITLLHLLPLGNGIVA